MGDDEVGEPEESLSEVLMAEVVRLRAVGGLLSGRGRFMGRDGEMGQEVVEGLDGHGRRRDGCTCGGCG